MPSKGVIPGQVYHENLLDHIKTVVFNLLQYVLTWDEWTVKVQIAITYFNLTSQPTTQNVFFYHILFWWEKTAWKMIIFIHLPLWLCLPSFIAGANSFTVNSAQGLFKMKTAHHQWSCPSDNKPQRAMEMMHRLFYNRGVSFDHFLHRCVVTFKLECWFGIKMPKTDVNTKL